VPRVEGGGCGDAQTKEGEKHSMKLPMQASRMAAERQVCGTKAPRSLVVLAASSSTCRQSKVSPIC
jgi:hypothetical protein